MYSPQQIQVNYLETDLKLRFLLGSKKLWEIKPNHILALDQVCSHPMSPECLRVAASIKENGLNRQMHPTFVGHRVGYAFICLFIA